MSRVKIPRFFCVLLIALFLAGSLLAAAAPKPPRLVVLVVVDQFRYDYLTRFSKLYTGGFRTLLSNGAVFTNAHLEHYPTATGVGHSTLLSGATPSFSGIIGNEWYDRETKKTIAGVFDPDVKLLGAEKGSGASPRRLMVSTVGDELKMAARGPSKVIGISFKDRAAILPVGRTADGAYWYDSATGAMISSTFYFPDLPAWVKQFNAERRADKFLGAEWKSSQGKVLRALPKEPGTKYYEAFERTPWASDFLLDFAQRAIEAEQLGRDEHPDILSVSLSTTDYVGHSAGPDSEEIRELNLNTDRSLGRFFQYLEKTIGPGGILFVFTADHGVAPMPEAQAQRRMPGGRLASSTLRKTAEAALRAKFGAGEWVEGASEGALWLNRETIRSRGLRQADVEEAAAEALAAVPQVFRVFTASRIMAGQYLNDFVGRRVANSYYPHRSADVIAILSPYWLVGSSGTSHGTPFSYDTHVPLVFLGPGIRPGFYDRTVAVNDIAPTLATLLEVETPSGSSGRVLYEMLDQPRVSAPVRPAAAPAKK